VEILKKYEMWVYSDGSVVLEECAINDEEEDPIVMVSVDTKVTESWFKYNLMTFTKDSEVFDELKDLPGDFVEIEFLGGRFKGKIDKGAGRIYRLGSMMKFAQEKNELEEGQEVTLLYDKINKVLSVIPEK